MKSWKADKNKNWLIGKSDKTLEARNFGKNHMLNFSIILIDPGTCKIHKNLSR